MIRIILFFLFVLATSCATFFPLKPYKKALVACTAEPWTGGANNGSRGATFSMKFYKLKQPLKADTMVVNNVPLNTEINTVGDTTYVSAFFYTDQGEAKTLANAMAYSGYLLIADNKTIRKLHVSEFRKVSGIPRP